VVSARRLQDETEDLVKNALQLSIVAPAFNEEAVLPAFISRAAASARSVAGDAFEIIVVDDGSTDATLAVLSSLQEHCPNLITVQLSRNFGQQLALTAGLSISRGRHVLIIDADLQDPPELLAAMLATAQREGAEVVYGKRKSRAGETILKRATSALFYRILGALSDTDIHRDTGDFRLLTRRVCDVVVALPERFRFNRSLIGWTGFKQVPLEYDREERAAGQTKYPLRKLIALALDATTGFSVRPLRVASYLGLICALASLSGIIYSLTAWFTGSAVAGWSSLISAVFLIGAAQLMVLGVIGEYLGRLYVEAKGRPLFIISRIVRPLGRTQQATDE
jgi:glycosyltransferase involved in cell wall biosynthesis